MQIRHQLQAPPGGSPKRSRTPETTQIKAEMQWSRGQPQHSQAGPTRPTLRPPRSPSGAPEAQTAHTNNTQNPNHGHM